MKRKQVVGQKILKGTFEFYLNDLEDLAAILLEAYGSIALEIDDHELTFVEIPELRRLDAEKVGLGGPASHVERWERRGVSVVIASDFLLIGLQDKYDALAIGVAGKLDGVLGRCRAEGPNPGEVPIETKCRIHLSPRHGLPYVRPKTLYSSGAPAVEAMPMPPPEPLVAASSACSKVEPAAIVNVADDTWATHWRMHKYKYIMGLITGIILAVVATVLRSFLGS